MYIEDSNSRAIDNTPKIRVIVRKRPLNKNEIKRRDQDIVEIRGTQTVVVKETKTKVDLTKFIEEHTFNFDRAFGEDTSNEQLYIDTVRPLVECLFQGAKVTCFAYGQTGSGKTFTMMGDLKNEDRHKAIPGLYLLAANDIFRLLDQPCFQHLAIYISFYEIYCGKLHDLLNDKQQLFAREDAKQNVNIVGLSEKRVLNVNSLMQIIDLGNSMRTTNQTSANSDSSRSHAILQIALKNGKKPYGKMSFIDLAGSERGADVNDTNKQTRKDGAEINKSLLALKECIRALDQDKKHTPFRGSKLTLVLKDSFTGNCKTVMIGNFSPGLLSCEHTLNTLRYADRVKELKKPTDDDKPKSQSDILAKQLMLPRSSRNTTRITIIEDEDEDDDIMVQGNTSHKVMNTTSHNNFLQRNEPQMQQMSQFTMKPHHENLIQRQSSLPTYSMNSMNSMNMNNNMNPLQNINFNNLAPLNNLTIPPQQQKNILPQATSHFMKETRATSPYRLPMENLFNLNNNNNNNNNSLTIQPNYNNLINYKQTPQNEVSPFTNKKNTPINSMSNFISATEFLQHANSLYQANSNKENFYNAKLQESQNNKFTPTNRTGQTTTRDSHKYNNNNTSTKPEQSGDIYVKVEEGFGGQPKPSTTLKLVNLVIMEEQEEMARIHKQYLDSMNEIYKRESALLKDITDPLTDPTKYIEKVESTLTHKMELMNVLRASLNKFKGKLREEEEFNDKFMNIFDLNKRDGLRSGELQLLDNLP